MRLRTRVALLVVAIGVVTVMASTSLVLLTTWLNHRTAALGDAVESVRLAEDALHTLLLVERTADPIVRADRLAALEQDLALAAAYVITDEEREVLGRAEGALAAYAEQEPRAYEGLFEAVRELAAINVVQARRVRAEAERLDRVGNGVGVFCAVAVPVVAAAAWLSVDRWLRPVLAIASAMQRYGAGDRTARAPAVGPPELREMAARFNDLATVLSGQQEAQLAFVAGVAHDLRNPLLALRLASSAARSPGADPARLLELVARQVDDLERMVGDLLDVARIQAGRLELRLGEHDVREVVRRVVDLFVASDGQRFSLRAPPSPVVARCDAARLAQVVTNLVSNAVKYSPPRSPVEVEVACGAAVATVRVRDQGVGISAAEREQLFEPFRRGADRSVGGAGMGLFVAAEIVSAHGGRMDVASERGLGSTFTVAIPLGLPEPAHAGDEMGREAPCSTL